MTNYGQPASLQNMHIFILEIIIPPNHTLWQKNCGSTSKIYNPNNPVAKYGNQVEKWWYDFISSLFSKHVPWGKLFFNYYLIKINNKKT